MNYSFTEREKRIFSFFSLEYVIGRWHENALHLSLSNNSGAIMLENVFLDMPKEHYRQNLKW